LAQHLGGLIFLFLSCNGFLLDIPDNSGRITVKEAKATYEAQLLESSGISKSRSGDLTMTHFNFNIGAITPDWKHSRTSHTDKMECMDTPLLDAEFAYRAIYPGDGKKFEKRTTYFYPKLVTMRPVGSEKAYSYIVFFIPSYDYSAKCKNGFSGKLLNAYEEQGDFSGVKVWTTLEGIPVSVSRYLDGHSIANMSLNGSLTTEEYVRRLKRATGMFGKIKVQRGHKDELNSLTKSVEDGDFSLIYLYDIWWADFTGQLYIYLFGQWYMLLPDGNFWPIIAPGVITGERNPNPSDNSNGNDDGGNDDGGDDEGGGPRTGGTAGSTTVKLNLTNIRYPGYVAGFRDCMQLSREIVAQFGVQPGSYMTMFQTNTSTNQLEPVGVDNVTNCEQYILEKINNGFPLIVGVDYKPGPFNGNNDGTVDHWVVVYGYGEDPDGHLMFWYIDTNRSAQNANRAYEDGRHQFYYDSSREMYIAEHIIARTDLPDPDQPYHMTVVREMNPL